MFDKSFTTSSGRKVHFQQLRIRTSDLGFLEGSAASIRSAVLSHLPEEIARTFGHTGLLLREPAPGPLPAYTFFVQLHSYTPIQPGADSSSLVVVWFGADLPECLPAELAAQMQGIEWERYAKDGNY
jgi:hypothetical protein